MSGTEKRQRILIVEDEESLASGLRFNFEQEGYEVTVAGDGTTAVDLFREPEQPFDLVILDLMLPSMSGYQTCQAIREIDQLVPVLVLSARSLSEDKALAFDCGTDQYMTKPFALPELLSRVRNLIERRAAANATENRRPAVQDYRFGEVTIDFGKYELRVGDQVHSLTKMEVELLRYFVEHEGLVLSRQEILEDVWRESPDITTRSIDNFVMRLRRMVEPDPSVPRHIVSVRGTGYRFIAEPEAHASTEQA